MKITDQRVRKTNEVLDGIKVIKLYGWEDSFLKVDILENLLVLFVDKASELTKYLNLYNTEKSRPIEFRPFSFSDIFQFKS